MKTPIQEVLETYEVMLSLHPEMAVSVRSVVEDLKSHLEKEKEVITSAYNKGKDYYFYNNTTMPNAEEYYNKTFKTKEK